MISTVCLPATTKDNGQVAMLRTHTFYPMEDQCGYLAIHLLILFFPTAVAHTILLFIAHLCLLILRAVSTLCTMVQQIIQDHFLKRKNPFNFGPSVHL